MDRRVVDVHTSTITIKNRTINDFLSDINKYKLLSSEEELDLILKYKSGDMEAGDRVICSHLRFVYSVCSKFQNDGNILDLINCAVIGMKDALASFDANKGFKFISWAVFYIRKEISLYYKSVHHIIRKPRNVVQLGNKPTIYREKFLQEHEYYPSNEQLKEIINENTVSHKVVEEGDLDNLEFYSFDMPFGEDGDTCAESSGPLAYRVSNQNEYDYSKEDMKRIIDILTVGLNEKEKTLIKFYLEERSRDYIADLTGYSYSTISRAYKSIFQKLKKKGKWLIREAI